MKDPRQAMLITECITGRVLRAIENNELQKLVNSGIINEDIFLSIEKAN